MKKVFYSKKFLNKVAEEMGATIDKHVRDVLMDSNTQEFKAVTRLSLTSKMKYQIKKWRIAMAEKIGGYDLHEHCSD